MTLMIVDDEITFREYLRTAVDWPSLGVDRICEAPDGEAALATARSHRPDLVLADIEMPRLDGLSCAGQLKSICPDCEIVLITGHEKFDYAREAIRLGISDFLLKPVTAREVGSVMQAASLKLSRNRATRYHTYLAEGLVGRDRFERAGGGDTHGEAAAQADSPADVRRCLAECLHTGDTAAAATLLQDWYGSLAQQGVPPQHALGMTLGMFTLCMEALARRGMAPRDVFGSGFSPTEALAGCGLGDMCEWMVGAVQSTIAATHRRGASRGQKLVAEAKRRIEAGYADEAFSVARLAQGLFVNEAHLRRLFKQYGEPSPVSCLKSVRMGHAMRLLRDEGKSVAETAGLVGFADACYFSRCFKQYFGCAPSTLEH